MTGQSRQISRILRHLLLYAAHVSAHARARSHPHPQTLERYGHEAQRKAASHPKNFDFALENARFRTCGREAQPRACSPESWSNHDRSNHDRLIIITDQSRQNQPISRSKYLLIAPRARPHARRRRHRFAAQQARASPFPRARLFLSRALVAAASHSFSQNARLKAS